MVFPKKRPTCRSHKSSSLKRVGARKASGNDGYALLIVMMLATVLMVSLTAALPSVYVEGQREREEELIFRGEQYARAIELFHTKFNRYPTSVKELLHTNDLSFLRRAYRDPIGHSGKWRFIHATATGVIIDSKILGSPAKQKGPNSGNQTQPSNSQNSTSGGESVGQAPGQTATGNNTFSLFGGAGAGAASGPGAQANTGSSMFGEKQKIIGAYIVGVASTSHKQSIRVFDGRTEYDEWEFIGVPGAPGAPVISQPGALQPAGNQSPTGNPASPSSPGQNPQANPFLGGGANSN